MRNPLASGVVTAPAFNHSEIPAVVVGTIGTATFIGEMEKEFTSGVPATREIEHHGLLLAGRGAMETEALPKHTIISAISSRICLYFS